MIRRSRLAARPRLERLDPRLVLSALTPAQLDSAYGLNAVTFKSGSTTVQGTGAGQTIAIVDAYSDPYIATEIAAFDKQYNLPAVSLTVDNLAGSGNYDASWAEEEALDVEWAHAAAPGAKIVLIEATSDSTNALIAGVVAAKAMPTVSVVSMSWGGSDSYGETALDSTFTTPAGHVGITYLAAAGDQPGAEWPADSPNVVAVGGTSLTINTGTGARASETAWTSSGGGTSSVEAEPGYQKGVQATGHRTAPDVSAVANPNTGVLEYSVPAGGWVQVGGTSLATPIWAGLISIADQGRVLAGKTSLDGATQTLPDLYAAPAADYTAIAANSRSAAGYNTTTGRGSPNAAALVATLVGDPAVGSATVPVTTTPVTTTPTTGSGTTTTPVGTAPTAPPYGGRWGGRWGGGGYRGYYFVGDDGGWTGPTVAKNSGQAAPTGLAPIVPITFSSPVPSGPSATRVTTPPAQTAPESGSSAGETTKATTTTKATSHRTVKHKTTEAVQVAATHATRA